MDSALQVSRVIDFVHPLVPATTEELLLRKAAHLANDYTTHLFLPWNGAEGGWVFDRAKGIVSRLGLSFTDNEEKHPSYRKAWGVYDWGLREIFVRCADPNHMAKTILHELSHALLVRPSFFFEGVEEIVAEGSAYATLSALGFEGCKESCEDYLGFHTTFVLHSIMGDAYARIAHGSEQLLLALKDEQYVPQPYYRRSSIPRIFFGPTNGTVPWFPANDARS